MGNKLCNFNYITDEGNNINQTSYFNNKNYNDTIFENNLSNYNDINSKNKYYENNNIIRASNNINITFDNSNQKLYRAQINSISSFKNDILSDEDKIKQIYIKNRINFLIQQIRKFLIICRQKKVITEKYMWDFLLQILSGLCYLHEGKRIIHGDIKLENILYDKEKNLKISDFGISAINNKNVDDMLKCHGIPIGSFNKIFINSNIQYVDNLNYKYIGNKINNVKEGFGIKKDQDGTKFSGIFHYNLANGFGKYIYSNEDIYRGELYKDKLQGYGIYNSINYGCIYEGYWIDDKQNFYGIEKWSKGQNYIGEYFYGKKNGIGIYTWNDNSKYYGEWYNNFINGYGIYMIKNKKKYMGEFVMNNIEGFGDMIYFDKNVRYSGFWENNKKEGFGIQINYDKNIIYIGFWKNNKKEGCGKIMNEKSEKYGYWKNNKLFQNINNYN